MAKYKTGKWANGERVMPGKRTETKHIDQLLKNGEIIVTGEDQTFIPAEKNNLLQTLFPDELILKNKLLYFKNKTCDGKEICFCTRNIIHLGGDWSSEKKRIEVPDDFPELYENNKKNNVETILLGIYHYYPDGKDGVRLYVSFSSNTYASRQTNNSAAHVHTIDLQNALNNGVYRRLDKADNELIVLDENNFIKYMHDLINGVELQVIKDEKQLLNYFGKMYSSLPKTLNGIQCYKEMFAANADNKNQSAWEGWYIEYYVKEYLKEHPVDGIEWWSSKKQGDLDFDLKFTMADNFYGDVKSDNIKKSVQGNKKSNIDILVKDKNGRLWYVVFEFTPEKDSEHENITTIWWNNALNADKSVRKKPKDLLTYKERMKYAIHLNNLSVYEINQFAFKYLKVFYVSPCDGKPREPKYQIPNKMKEFLRIYQCA
ncbi:hypothetical protein [Treponema sp.]|uniref:hypothetical protein n=1 Tax=Treponema sp. TaxID=166 RepID=UPI00298DB337|nr:hypothetical protein [Treponema sp.]MCR5614255.1 hypothetical protein [Treponema sp.]